MTLHEFDDYLTVLRGLLRTGVERREAIASELADHLNERYEELVRQGLTEREAARLALAEFGDAAALAADFLSINRNSRKRWIMRVTALSIGMMLIATVSWVTMWPGEGDRAIVSPAVAQTEGAAGISGEGGDAGGGNAAILGAGDATIPGAGFGDAGSPDSGGATGGGGIPAEESGAAGGGAAALPGGGISGDVALAGANASDGEPTQAQRNAATESALARRIAADFLEAPVHDVLAYLGDQLDVAFYIDRGALSEQGITIEDQSIAANVQLKQVRGDMLLDLVLGQHGMTYIVRDGIVIISTPDHLEGAAEVRVYNCRDLLGDSRLPHGWGSGGQEAGGAGMTGMAGMMSGGISQSGFAGLGMGGGTAESGAFGGGNRRRSSGMGSMTGELSSGMGMPGMGAGAMMGAGMTGGAEEMMPMAGGGASGAPSPLSLTCNPQAQLLINILMSAVHPESWEPAGGPGAITEYGGLLVVRSNVRSHHEIEKVLAMLREADQKEPGAAVRYSR